jgi:hypothetical protein
LGIAGAQLVDFDTDEQRHESRHRAHVEALISGADRGLRYDHQHLAATLDGARLVVDIALGNRGAGQAAAGADEREQAANEGA